MPTLRPVNQTAEWNRSNARYAAKRLLAVGYHHPTICEDIESGELYVSSHNRCWCARTVRSMKELADLLEQ